MNETKQQALVALVREFIAYWTTARAHGNTEVGCGMCGGIPHSATCYVGRMEALLAVPDSGGTDEDI